MKLNTADISTVIKQKIQDLKIKHDSYEGGTVISVADNIIRIYGLSKAYYNEIVKIEGGGSALILSLERDIVSAILLSNDQNVKEGAKVRGTGRTLEVPAGAGLLGRVVNALGEPIDDKGPIEASCRSPIERNAPTIMSRMAVNQTLHTGIKVIDALIPIGRGQRELIIGDRKTGKTQIAIDTILSQKDTDVKCIYVSIGKTLSSTMRVVKKLQEYGAMSYTTVLVASAADSPVLQYIAPYAGCVLGEFFMDHGQHALVIYDDLTKHAWSYRQISLLLRRAPGREAYPGDIFYLHSRLLERAACVTEEYVRSASQGLIKNKTGSLTALPIIETQSGDISAFVPTNVISITDGQIFLENSLFNQGIRPAVSVGNSVSRVGRAAQTPLMRQLSGGARLALAQYKELAAFAQLSADLDENTLAQLNRGQKTIQVMKQKPTAISNLADMALLFYALHEGFMDDLEVNNVCEFEKLISSYSKTHHQEFYKLLNTGKTLSAESLLTISKIIEKCKSLLITI